MQVLLLVEPLLESVMSDYRVNIKVRNARLLRAIEEAGYRAGGKFADLVGISYAMHLLAYLNLSRMPFDEIGDLRPCAEKLCVFLHKMPDELWSEDQQFPLETNSAEVELTAAAVQGLLAGNEAQGCDPLEILERREMLGEVDARLDTIHPKQSDVLRARFGFDGAPQTLDEIAKAKGLTRERVRQIEANALYKLRRRSVGLQEIAHTFGIGGTSA